MIEVAFTNGDTMTIENGVDIHYGRGMIVVETSGGNRVLMPEAHVLYVGQVEEDKNGNTHFI